MHRGASRRLLALLAAILAAVTAAVAAANAEAATVDVLGPGGKVSVRQDPYIPAFVPTPLPAQAHAARVRAPRRRPTRTVTSVLGGLGRSGAITSSLYQRYSSVYGSALATDAKLRGTPARELGAVIGNVRAMASAGTLTAARLPAVFATLQRNTQWWAKGKIPSADQLIEFSGSQIVWEYYPGQGIELQVLATFGKADGLYTAGAGSYGQMLSLLSEMIPLATRRGGGLTWEYYFRFEGGAPPWTSAMSQGTGIEALTRAYKATGQTYYLGLAHQALPIFTLGPPVGVAVKTPRGTRYVQYSFGPGEKILNAFLQALIGLYDYAQASNDPLAQRLFAAGDAEARWEVPQYDTGRWSLYEPGVLDSISYHKLVTGFLQELCTRTNAPVYCVTAQHFTQYLNNPPASLTAVTRPR